MRFSIIIPAVTPSNGLAARIQAYGEAVQGLGESYEIVVSATPAAVQACVTLADRHTWLRICDLQDARWGQAVRLGLDAARGEILCYANWQRTAAAYLAEMLSYAHTSPEIVFRANRRYRDTRRQRAGSLLFNLECRALLAVTAWDVNGTPKAFSRQHSRLLELRRDDDLIDAEFAVVCERAGYPVAEIPIEADTFPGETPPPDYLSALRMYAGVVGLRRRFGASLQAESLEASTP